MSEERPSTARASRWVRRLAWALLAVAVTACAGYLALQTSEAKRLVAAGLERLLSSSDGVTVSIQGLDGRLPGRIRAERVVLRDPRGVWLTAEGVAVDASPTELVAGRIRLTAASVERVDLVRLPRTEADDAATAAPPLTLIVDRLEVASVFLGAAAGGRRADASEELLPASGEVRGLVASGRISLSTQWARISFAADKADASGLLPDGADVTSGPIHVQGRIAGWLMQPSARIELDARTVRTPAGSTERLHATAAAKPVAPGREGTDWAVTLEATASGLSPNATVADVLGSELRVRLEGRVPGGDQPPALRLDVVAASSGPAELRSRGAWSASALELSGLHVEGIDLAKLARRSGVAVDGSLSIDGDLRYDLATAALAVTARAVASGFASDSQWLEALLGPRPRASADLRLESNGDLTAESFGLDGAAMHATGKLRRAASDGRLDAAVSATSRSLAPLSSVLGASVTGAGTLEATVEGPPKRLVAHARWDATEVSVAGSKATRVNGSLEAAGAPEAASGRLLAAVALGPERVEVDVRGTLDREAVRLEAIRARGAGIDLAGEARVERSSGLADGRLAGDLASLGAVADLLGFGVSGRMHVVLVAAHQGRSQQLDIDATTVGLHAFGSVPVEIRASEASVHASVAEADASMQGRITLEMREASVAGIALDGASVAAASEGANWRITSSVKGSTNEPFDLRMEAELAGLDDGWRLRIDSLRGTLAEQPVALASSCTVTNTRDLEVDDVALTIGDGRIHGSGEWGSERLQASLDVESLPLQLVRLYEPSWRMQGALDARLRASGPRRAPQIELHAAAAGARLEGGDRADMPPFDARLQLERRGDRIHADLVLDDGQGTQLRANVAAGAAAATESDPGRILDPGAPLSVHVEGQVDAALLADLARLGEERVGGRVEGILEVKGTLERPRVSGRAKLLAGMYASAYSGATLRDVEATLVGEGTRLVVEDLSARDDNGGTLRAGGAIDFSAGLGRASYRAEAILDDLHVVQLDALAAETDGELALQGQGRSCTLKGRLDLRTASVAVPDELPPHVVELDVVEIGGDELQRGRNGSKRDARFSMALDLGLRLAKRGYIRGRGLDSEWKGKAHVGGTTEAPIYEGTFNLVRGTFGLLGVPFTVTSGRVDFDGGSTVDPILDVTAEARRNDILGKISITGRASRPRITLSSDPALPSDQVLSQLLFGQTPGKLSALQSVQLAEGLARLSGNRAGPDLLGGVRSTLGLDKLGLSSEGEGVGGSILSVGKYVGKGIYLSVNQGLTNASSKATVEIELTPSLRLGSEVGVDAPASLGLTWRHDY